MDLKENTHLKRLISCATKFNSKKSFSYLRSVAFIGDRAAASDGKRMYVVSKGFVPYPKSHSDYKTDVVDVDKYSEGDTTPNTETASSSRMVAAMSEYIVKRETFYGKRSWYSFQVPKIAEKADLTKNDVPVTLFVRNRGAGLFLGNQAKSVFTEDELALHPIVAEVQFNLALLAHHAGEKVFIGVQSSVSPMIVVPANEDTEKRIKQYKSINTEELPYYSIVMPMKTGEKIAGLLEL